MRRALALVALLVSTAGVAGADLPLPPELTAPVNDFARVIDPENAQRLDRLIRELQQKTGDVIVVATIETIAPYGAITDYAVKMFANRGRGLGGKAEDGGVLVLLAVRDRKVQVEVGYGIEPYITDGFAGETSRVYMAPHFREGRYGAGLLAGVTRLAGRIAEARGVTLSGAPAEPAHDARESSDDAASGLVTLGGIILFLVVSGILSSIRNVLFPGRRRRRRWGAGPWSGWNSGVGPFGGGSFGGGFGGFGGGGGGGGFGGFGGGSSGGGGGGASW